MQPTLAISTVIFALREDENGKRTLMLPLVQRIREPHLGKWALPGGPLNANEDLDAAAARNLSATTALEPRYLEQLYAFGNHERYKNLKRTGCDLYDSVPTLKNADYVKGSIYELPFADNSFDIVTCHHTIEHLRELPDAIKELKRVAKKQLIIVTPRQRYYYYTMDMHLNFYPIASYLQEAIQIEDNVCKDIHGDWVYLGKLNK